MNKIAENIIQMPFIVGVVFFVAGLVMYQFPPKNINYLYGYRTSSSMKSQERWDFAQRFSSFRIIEGGLFLILISFLKLLFVLSTDLEIAISFGILTVVLVYLFLSTEKALKKKFPNK